MATGADLAQQATSQLGKMYAWAAAGPDEFDCSGLMYWAAHQLGITIPRTTYDMVGSQSNLIPIGRGDLRTGDLIFSNWGSGADSHVSMYLGDGRVVEAPQEGEPVQINPFSDAYAAHATNYRRIPGISQGKGATTPAEGFLTGALTGAGGLGRAIQGWINAPKTVTDAMTNVGNAAGDMAQSVASVGRLATLVSRMFLPSNILRAFAMFFGILFVLIGIWFLGREVKEAS